jgi:hypothetical protein
MTCECSALLPISFFTSHSCMTVMLSTLRWGPWVRAATLKCLPLPNSSSSNSGQMCACHAAATALG